MNENARRPIAPKGDYKVGYGRPPVHSRFQPGRSGNPRGRPKRLQPTVAGIVSQELNRPVTVREGEKVTSMTAFQALVRSSLGSAIKGNASALRSLVALVETAENLNTRYPPDAEQPSPASVARAVAAIIAQAEAEEAGEAQRQGDEEATEADLV